jgi:hypothetical protein
MSFCLPFPFVCGVWGVDPNTQRDIRMQKNDVETNVAEPEPHHIPYQNRISAQCKPPEKYQSKSQNRNTCLSKSRIKMMRLPQHHTVLK